MLAVVVVAMLEMEVILLKVFRWLEGVVNDMNERLCMICGYYIEINLH